VSIGLLCVTAAVVYLCVIAIASTWSPAHAQSPSFDVATIKLSDAPPNAGALLNFPSPQRMSITNFSLRMLIGSAFGPELGQGYQVAGGPDWLEKDRFVVQGQAAGTATRAEMIAMLRTLLVERFGLKYHVENKDVDAYAPTASLGRSSRSGTAPATARSRRRHSRIPPARAALRSSAHRAW
jgi:uncharacterized protein (TIGR03435 family)